MVGWILFWSCGWNAEVRDMSADNSATMKSGVARNDNGIGRFREQQFSSSMAFALLFFLRRICRPLMWNTDEEVIFSVESRLFFNVHYEWVAVTLLEPQNSAPCWIPFIRKLLLSVSFCYPNEDNIRQSIVDLHREQNGARRGRNRKLRALVTLREVVLFLLLEV